MDLCATGSFTSMYMFVIWAVRGPILRIHILKHQHCSFTLLVFSFIFSFSFISRFSSFFCPRKHKTVDSVTLTFSLCFSWHPWLKERVPSFLHPPPSSLFKLFPLCLIFFPHFPLFFHSFLLPLAVVMVVVHSSSFFPFFPSLFSLLFFLIFCIFRLLLLSLAVAMAVGSL